MSPLATHPGSITPVSSCLSVALPPSLPGLWPLCSPHLFSTLRTFFLLFTMHGCTHTYWDGALAPCHMHQVACVISCLCCDWDDQLATSRNHRRAMALQTQRYKYRLYYEKHCGWQCNVSECVSAAQLKVSWPAGRNLCLCEQLCFTWASFHVHHVVCPAAKWLRERRVLWPLLHILLLGNKRRSQTLAIFTALDTMKDNLNYLFSFWL